MSSITLNRTSSSINKVPVVKVRRMEAARRGWLEGMKWKEELVRFDGEGTPFDLLKQEDVAERRKGGATHYLQLIPGREWTINTADGYF